MPDQSDMSPASKELFKKLRMIVPPMLEKFHKGAATFQFVVPHKAIFAMRVEI